MAPGSAGRRRSGRAGGWDVPWAWIPFVLLWPPFAEPLIGGNVQVLLFAAFVAIYVPSRSRTTSERRDRFGPAGPPAGWRAALIWAFKIGQVQPWLHVLRWRRRAAILGLAYPGHRRCRHAAGGRASTCGTPGSSSCPTRRTDWPYGGFSLVRLLPGIGLVICVGATLGVLFVGPRSAGPAVGILTVIGAPSLYVFGLLFLFPAMLRIRREIALVAAT